MAISDKVTAETIEDSFRRATKELFDFFLENEISSLKDLYEKTKIEISSLNFAEPKTAIEKFSLLYYVVENAFVFSDRLYWLLFDYSKQKDFDLLKIENFFRSFRNIFLFNRQYIELILIDALSFVFENRKNYSELRKLLRKYFQLNESEKENHLIGLFYLADLFEKQSKEILKHLQNFDENDSIKQNRSLILSSSVNGFHSRLFSPYLTYFFLETIRETNFLSKGDFFFLKNLFVYLTYSTNHLRRFLLTVQKRHHSRLEKALFRLSLSAAFKPFLRSFLHQIKDSKLDRTRFFLMLKKGSTDRNFRDFIDLVQEHFEDIKFFDKNSRSFDEKVVTNFLRSVYLDLEREKKFLSFFRSRRNILFEETSHKHFLLEIETLRKKSSETFLRLKKKILSQIKALNDLEKKRSLLLELEKTKNFSFSKYYLLLEEKRERFFDLFRDQKDLDSLVLFSILSQKKNRVFFFLEQIPLLVKSKYFFEHFERVPLLFLSTFSIKHPIVRKKFFSKKESIQKTKLHKLALYLISLAKDSGFSKAALATENPFSETFEKIYPINERALFASIKEIDDNELKKIFAEKIFFNSEEELSNSTFKKTFDAYRKKELSDLKISLIDLISKKKKFEEIPSKSEDKKLMKKKKFQIL